MLGYYLSYGWLTMPGCVETIDFSQLYMELDHEINVCDVIHVYA